MSGMWPCVLVACAAPWYFLECALSNIIDVAQSKYRRDLHNAVMMCPLWYIILLITDLLWTQ
jgi:hypothetical protein